MILRIGNENCQDCELVQYRQHVVKNVINTEAEIAIVGMMPGGEENKTGDPFCSSQQNESAGKNLNTALTKIGINRNDVSIMNCALCTHPENKLNKKNWFACKKYFFESLKAMPNLKLVFVMGNDAYKCIADVSKAVMKEVYCKVYKNEQYGNVLFIPNYHPASIINIRAMKDPDRIRKFYEGFKIGLDIFNSLKVTTKKHNYILVKTEEQLWPVLAEFEKQTSYCPDLETTSVKPHKAKILCISLSWEPYTAVSIPIWYVKDGVLQKYWSDETEYKIVQVMKKVCTDPNKQCCGQNKRYDSLVLRNQFGFGIENIVYDIMLGTFVLNCNDFYNLESITTIWLPEEAGVKASFWQGIPPEELRNETWFLNIDLDTLLLYGCHDADVELRITLKQTKAI